MRGKELDMKRQEQNRTSPEAKTPKATIYGTPAARRKVRPLVLVDLGSFIPLEQKILAATREFDWQLVDWRLLGHNIPVDPPPDGALLRVGEPALYRRLKEANCPLVEIQALLPARPAAWPVVALDLRKEGRLAADHFIERGFRHVAFLGHKPLTNSQNLYDAFRERAAELGCNCELFQLAPRAKGAEKPEEVLYRQHERQIVVWLRKCPKPIGILTYSDIRAAKLCTVARRAGFLVPDDVAILGHGNNVYACEVSPVPLSSINVGYEQLAQHAARLLRNLMQGAPAPAKPLLFPPAGIVTRQSTDVLATPDPHVAAALRYIWDHLDLNLKVDDIARNVGVQRRRLERAFRQHLDRGVNEELRRKRLEVFRELLTTTNLPICELAPAVGFRTTVHMQRLFRRAYGMTPREWRRQNTR